MRGPRGIVWAKPGSTGQMTALDKYVRLESGGLWRPDAEAQRRDVVISFGDATLVISDGVGRPLAHWSLPALERQNRGEMPAIYAPDEGADEPVDAASRELLRDQIRSALDFLTDREREVLELRFGLRDGKDHTLEEVGKRFGVTRERIRQIEAKALEKVRRHKIVDKLKDY